MISMMVPALAALLSILFPAVALWVSEAWKSRLSEEQLVASLADDIRSKIIPVTVDLDRAARALDEPCAASRRVSSRSSFAPECVKFYAERLRELDSQIVRLSWTVDSLPVGPDSYRSVKRLKEDFWQGCDDGTPSKGCGYRQRLVRIIRGLGGGQPRRALFACPSDLIDPQRDAVAAEKCWGSLNMLSTVIKELTDQANQVFCAVASDVNRRHAGLLQQHEKTKTFGDQLERNVNQSDCRALLKKPLAYAVSASTRN